MSPTGEWLIVLLMLNAAILALFAYVIWAFMPKTIKQAMQANGVRLDRTVSSKRQKIENADAAGVVGTTVAFVIPFLLVANAFILYTHARVAPIPMAMEAFQNFSFDKEVWNDRLTGKQTHNLSMRFQDWQKKNGAENDESILQLVESWPAMLVALCVFTILLFAICARIYIAGLTRLQSRVAKRHQDYLAYDMRDRHQLVEFGELKPTESSLAN